MPSLSPPVFSILTSLVRERLGLNYGAADEAVFADKLSLRMAEAGFSTPLDYYYYLRYDPHGEVELNALADALVVNETYFFRETDALVGAINEVIAPAVGARGSASVWCAGCATGEEPLSLAMLLAERRLLQSTRIVATDLSHRAIRRAREASYSQRSLRMLETTPTGSVADLLVRHVRQSNGAHRVDPRIVERVDFRQLNLLDAAAVAALGTFDVVLCRNVLIYFDEDTTREVLGSLVAAIKPNGCLAVGASESLLRFGTSLACEERGGVFLYRKRP